MKPDNLVRFYLAIIYLIKQGDHVLYRLIQYLKDQILNMSCMESGEDIHLERTTGCQPRLDTTTTASLTQGGPTVLSIAEGNLFTHERWHLPLRLKTSTINMMEGTVFRVTVVRCNHGLTIVWRTF